jgi:hypothetical protein
MLLRRDVMVGFFGFKRASAAACTLLAPEVLTACGRAGTVSDCECTEEAVEAEADVDAVGLPAVLGGLLFAGAAMFLAFLCIQNAGTTRMEVQWIEYWDSLAVVCSVWRRRCLAGKKPRCFIVWLSKPRIVVSAGWWRSGSGGAREAIYSAKTR